VTVTLPEEPLGSRDVALNASNVDGVPRDVRVDFVSPDRLTLAVERRVERRLPVEPTFIGEPPAGFAYYGAEVRPEELLVVGPASEVESIDRLSTGAIRLGALTSPSTFYLAVALPEPPHVRLLDSRPVEVRVAVYPAPVEQTFSSIAVETAGGVLDARVSPSTATVTLSGPPQLLQLVRPELLRAVADIDGLDPRAEPYRLPLRLDFRDMPGEELDLPLIRVKSIRPREVVVYVGQRRSTP